MNFPWSVSPLQRGYKKKHRLEGPKTRMLLECISSEDESSYRKSSNEHVLEQMCSRPEPHPRSLLTVSCSTPRCFLEAGSNQDCYQIPDSIQETANPTQTKQTGGHQTVSFCPSSSSPSLHFSRGSLWTPLHGGQSLPGSGDTVS